MGTLLVSITSVLAVVGKGLRLALFDKSMKLVKCLSGLLEIIRWGLSKKADIEVCREDWETENKNWMEQ